MNSPSFYITTPIYYINGVPHIGHAYTTIAADCLSRHKRQKGCDVYFLTGTDEHGQKVLKVAQEKGLTPIAFADSMIPYFKDAWKKLDVTYDDFIRTTEKRHMDTVQYVLQRLHEQGDLYLGEYEGLYCVPCEVFWTEKQVVGNFCPDCKRPVEKIKETNYFFKISKYKDWLIDYIRKNPSFIRPAQRENEALGLLNLGLNDLCISRPKSRMSWGIPLPFSPDHVTYVWFDALINYISALGYPDNTEKFNKYWPESVHLIGKDILKQHAIFWPIMLHAIGLNPPKAIFAHGWWQVGEEKMSKSLGNVVNPLDVIDEFGIDVFRYFLMREVSFGSDGVFSREAVIKRFNADLANDLGNLVYRTLTMIEKHCNGRIPALNRDLLDAFAKEKIMPFLDNFGGADITGLGFNVGTQMDLFNFSGALEAIWGLIAHANKYIEETKPWNLKKENKIQELENFLALLIVVIRAVAHEISPFMPQTAEKILAQIKTDKVEKTAPLFPRIDVD